MTRVPMDKVLLVAGALLFLLGLLQGAIVDLFVNPRMALSAHLTAVQSGTAIMVAGGIWSSVMHGPLLASITRWTIITGIFGLWIALSVSAATGASDALPLAGAGYSAAPGTERFVEGLVVVSSVVMVAGWALLLSGLVRSKP